jgi:uncharacterized 2Fe-2S/4Fe-4S cluster protein (DUF4445 family)
MKINLKNSGLVFEAGKGETILLACARAGVILSAPCGGRGRCGKCKVRLLEGQVSGDTPDAEGWVRACRAIPLNGITIAFAGNGAGNSEILDNEVSGPVSAVRRPPARAAVALDIGTTTVSARLVDLDSALALDTISELNDQRVFGADVMSRIGAARNGKTGELFTLINHQTKRILDFFQKRWGLSHIEKLSVSGNTTMAHLFLNVDPSGMGGLPFTPVFLEERELSGDALSLPVESVTVLPAIAAFIGADITAGLAVLDILDTPGPSLFIDIGTNGEMALSRNGSVFCCSTAAGPAFEGAEISCGMGGVKGAISRVEPFADKSAIADASADALSISTIGNVPPLGICGSGLIDAVAVMLKREIIDETGRMADDAAKEFHLAPGISITARDIRQFQLAKSAILSGIRILCKSAGLNPIDVKNVFVAGGFGFFVNKQNAISAGIFPEEFIDAISICGNSSLQGAEDNLSEEGFMSRCKEIISKCSVIDLAKDPSFMDEFAENMLFNV